MNASQILRVLTYNIFHGEFTKEDLTQLGHEIARMNADIVGLQEVDMYTSRMNGQNTLQQIAEAGGYPHYAFSKAIDYAGGGYGTAIMSRYPILSFETIPLESGAFEHRAYGHAVIDVNGTSIDFFNTHICVENREVRLAQIQTVADAVSNCKTFVLTGDFNTDNLSDFDVFQNTETLNQKEFLTYYPGSLAIDHIFLSHNIHSLKLEMPACNLSDHYPLIAEVELIPSND